MAIVLGVAIAAAYAAYQRVGTTANADSVEFTVNLAGGFLAIGMTDDQPGFILLSELEQDRVDLNTTQVVNSIAGSYTLVDVQTPQNSKHIRLRGPQVLLVLENGAVEKHDVDWSTAEFNALRKAADCSHEAAVKKHRCGAPFTDLQEALATWPRERIPDRIRGFLERFKDHRVRKREDD